MSCENSLEVEPQIKVAVCLIFEKDGKILLVRQSPIASKDPGLWGPPGGHVHFSEKVQDAAKREVKEELGNKVEIEVKELMGYMEQISPYNHLFLAVFACNILKGNIRPSHEVDRYAWVGEEEIENYLLRPSAEMYFNQILRLGNLSLLL